MEVMVDFEYMIKIIDNQMFQVQFRCDMQVYWYVECVVVCDEWVCISIIRDYVYYWCFYFYELF